MSPAIIALVWAKVSRVHRVAIALRRTALFVTIIVLVIFPSGYAFETLCTGNAIDSVMRCTWIPNELGILYLPLVLILLIALALVSLVVFLFCGVLEFLAFKARQRKP